MLPVGFGMAFSLFGDLTLFAVLVTQLDVLGLTFAQTGILLSIHRLIRIPLNPVVGWIQDRFGRRVPFIAGMLLAVASTAAYGLVRGFWPFLLARLAWGTAWSLINVGGLAMALDLADEPGNGRGRLAGIYNTWMWIGYGIGPVVGSLLTDWTGFRAAMLVCAGLSGLGLMAALLFLPETRPEAAHPIRIATLADGALTDNPPGEPPNQGGWIFKGMFLYAANQFAVDGIILSTTTLLVTRRVGEEFGLFGLVMGAGSLGGLILAGRSAFAALFSQSIGRLSDRRQGRLPVLVAGLVAGIAGFFLLAIAQSIPVILLGVMASAVSASVLLVVLPALVGDQAPLAQRARITGQLAAAGDVGSTLGPFLALSLAPLLDLGWIYLGCVALFGVGLALVRWNRPARVIPANSSS